MWKPRRCFPRLEITNRSAASTTHLPVLEDSTWTLTGLAQTVQRQDRKCVPSLTPSRTTPQIRIVGGRSSYEGRVEVQVGSKWGTVCSTGWTTKEAMVVCRQLGLGYSMHAITVSRNEDLNHTTSETYTEVSWLELEHVLYIKFITVYYQNAFVFFLYKLKLTKCLITDNYD